MALIRVLTAPRFEELLAAIGLLLFWLLDHLRISRFDFWTQFFREGLYLYLGLAGLVLLVETARFLLRRRTPGAGWRWVTTPLRFLRDWAPFVLLLTVYENLIWLVARVNPRLYDAPLQRLDDLLLGGHSTFWLERFASAARTEWFSFFYNILFAYPVLVGGLLYLLGRSADYRRWVLSFSLAGYLGFCGYLLVPAIGPTYYYADVYRKDLSGRLVHPDLELLLPEARAPQGASDAVSAGTPTEPELALYQLAQRLNRPDSQAQFVPRNCFPSLHTAWGLIILLFTLTLPRLRILGWLLLFPIVNLIAATLYLRFHYFVDLLAGAMLALLVLTLVPWLLRGEERLRAWLRGGGPEEAVAPEETMAPGGTVSPARPPGTASAPTPISPLASLPSRRTVLLRLGLVTTFFAAIGLYLARWEPSDQLVQAQQELLQAHRLDALPPALTTQAAVSFGQGALRLEAVALSQTVARPGEQLRLESYWRRVKPLPPHWKIFVHVEGTGRQNRDHHPLLGALRLADLPAGQLVRDPQLLVAEARLGQGEITVWLGVFDERQPLRRLPVDQPGGRDDGHDRVRGATFRIVP